MPISQSDLSLKKAENNSDLSTNGGWMSNALVPTSLFPDVTGAEREAGITRYRKIFLKNDQGAGTPPNVTVELALLQAKAYLENITPADDFITIKPGAVADTQAEAALYTGWAGAGFLVDTVLTPNATTCDVEVEVDGSVGEIFQVGGFAVLTNGLVKNFVILTAVTYIGKVYTLEFDNTPITSGFSRAFESQTADIITANTIGKTTAGMDPHEYIGKLVRIKAATNGAAVGQTRRVVDNTASTLTLNYDFSILPTGTVVYEILYTFVAMCASLGTVIASYSGVTKTFGAGGAFDETKIILYPIGTKDDQWTLLFQDPTTFSITGLKNGLIGGGTISTATKPSTGTSFYFEIPANAWSTIGQFGEFQVGDSVVFVTVSSSKSFWLKETVPALANPHKANTWDLGISGDTV
jgi:hypothetical protein